MVDGKLAGVTDAAIDNAINVALADFVEGKNNNNNYELGTVTMGKLNIVPGVIITFDLAEEDIEDQYAEADGQEGINVRFKNTQYTIPGGQWRTLVLPFNITPLDFCNMTGVKQYAIFNTLTSADASTNVVRFSLEQELLPANTPFLVKAPENIVLDNVEFTGRNFEYDETPTATVTNANFIGSYVDTDVAAGDHNMQFWGNQGFKPITAAFANYSFHAYLQLSADINPNEARILVQEADGSTTAINAITGEQQNFAKGAWYTVNGVKVNGIPTEKGVYIKNGKKVVIK